MRTAIVFVLAFSLVLGMAFAETGVRTDSAAESTPLKVSATIANGSGSGSATGTGSSTSESEGDSGSSPSGSGGSSSGAGEPARGPDYAPTPTQYGGAGISTGSQGGGNGSGAVEASRGENSPNNNSEDKPEGETNRWQLTVTASNGEALQNAGEIEAVQVSPGRVEVQSRAGNESPTLLANNQSGGQVQVEAQIALRHANASSPLSIQPRERETIMQMNGTEVSTAETLRIRNRTMYLERNGTEYRLNVLPSDLAEAAASLAPSQNITLGFEGDVPAYAFRVAERRMFLGIFDVDSETSFTLNARNGSILREEGPWWGALAPVQGQLREALGRISKSISDEGQEPQE
ncbi:hypothetical protein JW721_00395 [Candidatus Micrarchaeota archaeon]|nr:hypothetical protein [Candidatus Micrarchaeota archaeon]